ncbi:hypothetical protein [Vibrio aerogenes]|uniref:hypothetical protein n=1 Tax=Vibrio aerogenes TaxID=92172 RepID=UPI000937015F|nr:hypothetical protein [Vibrio aerogenes]
MALKLEALTCDLAALVVAGFFHCSEFASGRNKGKNELLSSSPGMHSHAQHGNERKQSQIKESPKDEQTRRLFKIFLAREGDKNWSCHARTQAKYKKDFFGGFWSFKNRLGRLRQKPLGSAKRISAP